MANNYVELDQDTVYEIYRSLKNQEAAGLAKEV